MAVEFKDKDSYSRVNDYSFDPAALKINPKLNGRHDLPDIEWLIADIAANGQLEPVLIRSDGGTPVLCAGEQVEKFLNGEIKEIKLPAKLSK